MAALVARYVDGTVAERFWLNWSNAGGPMVRFSGGSDCCRTRRVGDILHEEFGQRVDLQRADPFAKFEIRQNY
jgi:hypothetical protein